MAWRCTGKSNAELVSNLAASGLIKNERVMRAMSGVDRAHYCPRSYLAYEDSPQVIGHGATISAPHMHASACESLLPFLHPTARVLDIGSGSGYLTHVLANLMAVNNTSSGSTSSNTTDYNNNNIIINASPPPHSSTSFTSSDDNKSQAGGKVVGIDHIQPLVDLATTNMSKSTDGQTLLAKDHVRFICADGRKGYKELGPYDAIHVGAAAQSLHPELLDQLKCPGRMFIPVEEDGGGGGMRFGGNQSIWVVDKDQQGNVKKKKSVSVSYVPLTDAPSTTAT